MENKIIDNKIKSAYYLIRLSDPSDLVIAKEIIDNCNATFLNIVKSKVDSVVLLGILGISIEASLYTPEIKDFINEERTKFEQILIDKLGIIKTRG